MSDLKSVPVPSEFVTWLVVGQSPSKVIKMIDMLIEVPHWTVHCMGGRRAGLERVWTGKSKHTWTCRRGP